MTHRSRSRCRTMLCDEPLRLALRNRHVEVARTLLEAGANPNKRYFFGSEINLVSPLDLECMELLLAFGAYPNTRDRAGLTPLMKAARLPQVTETEIRVYRDFASTMAFIVYVYTGRSY